MKKLALALTMFVSTTALAGTAFYTGEQVSGLKKICYYDYLGDTVAITISSAKVCPVSIQV